MYIYIYMLHVYVHMGFGQTNFDATCEAEAGGSLTKRRMRTATVLMTQLTQRVRAPKHDTCGPQKL